VIEHLRTACEHAAHASSTLNASQLATRDVREAVELCGRLSKLVDSVLAGLAPRWENESVLRRNGERSGAEWAARQLGRPVRHAQQLVTVGNSLAALPELAAAVRAGDLSVDQAVIVAEGARDCPDAETVLVKAARSGLDSVRTAAKELRTKTLTPGELAARQHAKRTFWSRIDDDGMVAGGFRLTPTVGAELVAVIGAVTDRKFRAQPAGPGWEQPSTLAADALADLIRAGATHPAWGTPSQPRRRPTAGNPDTSSNPRTGTTAPSNPPTGSSPTNDRTANTRHATNPRAGHGIGTEELRRNGPTVGLFDDFTDLVDHSNENSADLGDERRTTSHGDSRSGPRMPTDGDNHVDGTPIDPWSSVAELPHSDEPNELTDPVERPPSVLRPTVHVIIDHRVLTEKHPPPGTKCEIPGTGTVDPEWVRSIIGDAFLTFLVKNGENITTVAHAGRAIPAHLKTALTAGGYRCCVDGCTASAWLEADHSDIDYAKGGVLSWDNTDWLCKNHHRQKTAGAVLGPRQPGTRLRTLTPSDQNQPEPAQRRREQPVQKAPQRTC
jgi:hypothetical protein